MFIVFLSSSPLAWKIDPFGRAWQARLQDAARKPQVWRPACPRLCCLTSVPRSGHPGRPRRKESGWGSSDESVSLQRSDLSLPRGTGLLRTSLLTSQKALKGSGKREFAFSSGWKLAFTLGNASLKNQPQKWWGLWGAQNKETKQVPGVVCSGEKKKLLDGAGGLNRRCPLQKEGFGII